MLADDKNDNLRFSDIFESAGVSRGSAYRIYNGIDDLMQDLSADWLQNFVNHMANTQLEAAPTSWMQLSDRLIERGAEYWAETAVTLRALPRIRSNAPTAYRTAVTELSACLGEIFGRYFQIPNVPDWHHKLGFYTQLCDNSFSDAVRAEGRIDASRLEEAQILCRTYLGFHLPATLQARQSAAGVRGGGQSWAKKVVRNV